MSQVQTILPAVNEAAAIALEYFRRTSLSVGRKGDGSVVTEADIAVDRVLVPALEAVFPEATVVSEERPVSVAGASERLILLDPIDGTTAFASGVPGFCISVGIVDNGVPVAGIVSAPAWGTTWYCDLDATSPVYRNGEPMAPRDSARRLDSSSTALVDSKLHRRLEIDGFPGRCRSFGSTALHLCLVADSARFSVAHSGRVYPWDIAGAHAIATRRGLKLENLSGEPFCYSAVLPASRLPDDILLGTANDTSQFRAFLKRRGQ